MKTGRSAWFRISEGLQYGMLAASMLAVIVPIGLTLYYLLSKGLPAINWTFLTQPPENQMKGGGIMPAIVGTLYLLLGTFIFALPLGVLGAVYITEYGRRSRLTRMLRLAIVNLAGVPSIVYGLFGLGFFVLVIGSGIDRAFFHSPELRQGDIKSVADIVTRLQNKPTPFDEYLATKIRPATWEAVNAYHPELEPLSAQEDQDRRMARLLAADLNQVLSDPKFYSEERFGFTLPLSEGLVERAAQKPAGDRLAVLNREILEEGLQGEIGGHRRLRFGTGGIVWASLTMALLILPVVITASEEALLSVPDSFRQASLSLGCTRWQTVRQIVLPNALPGILTGMILGLSRAAGETAPILLLGASFFLPSLPEGPHSPFMALPYHLFIMSTQAVDAPERIPWGTALVLVAIALGLNTVASAFRSRARAGRKW